MNSRDDHCQKCFVGRYRDSKLPYLCWIDDRQVVVPDVPGSQCDMCGDSHHNPGYIEHLHRLIDRGALSNQSDTAILRQPSAGGKSDNQSIGRSAKS